MTEQISSDKTIAKNTLFLYFRMMFTMLVSLYTSRVNLSVLGIEDNGIYQVVGGVVAMFAFLNGALSGATSRFLTYELGKGNMERLKKTFASALNIHILVAIIIFILSETVGLYFLEKKLIIPDNRVNAAYIVYQVSIFASMISITQVPYNASIISHEKMGVFAYMSILDVSLKLIICYLLYITPIDKLVTYGVLILCETIGLQLIYRIYCIRHFEECHFKLVRDKTFIKPIFSFAGWDLFGNFSVMARGQGVNIIMNMFFGPVINSAAGFSTTIGSNVLGFSNNFLTAIRPPIVKAYSQNQIEKMESLMINASKYSFSLLLLLSTPFIFESQYILKLWLKTPPPYTETFCVLELILSVLSSIFLPLVFAIHATGKIKFMSITNGTIWLMVVPITYFLLKAGYPPVIPYITKIFLLIFVVVSNIYSTKKNIPQFNILLYIRHAFIPSIIAGTLVIFLTYIVYNLFNSSSLIRFITVCCTSIITVVITTYFIVFEKETRNKIKTKIFHKVHMR